jgi:hypothetical protein
MRREVQVALDEGGELFADRLPHMRHGLRIRTIE